jgi:L-asparaginase II
VLFGLENTMSDMGLKNTDSLEPCGTHAHGGKLSNVSHVHVLRGGLLESRHRIHAAILRPDGSLLTSVGDPNHTSFLRSAAKAFQALPLVPRMERYGLEARHLAVAMASHAGEDIHVQTVQDMQERAGIDPGWLVCGVHAPFNPAARSALKVRGEKPTVLHNNCSGKHSGMIAVSLANGWGHVGYQRPDHPLQQEILRSLQELMSTDEVGIAVDGCSVPCFRVPLRAAALGAVRLANPPSAPEHHRDTLEIAFQAARANPLLIAGTGRIDSVLIEHVPGLISKIGAEAFMLVSVRDTRHGPLGIAMKVEDGAERVLEVAMLSILEQLGMLDTRHPALHGFAHPILKNVAGLEVGTMRSTIALELPSS